MAATAARLIVLATVIHLEPATGYAVRKHLQEQGAAGWADLSTASIYSVLRTLTKRGSLEAIDDPTGVRSRTLAYRTTSHGRDDFQRLWQSAIETIAPAQPLAFHVAITLTALVPRERYITALSIRLRQIELRSDSPPAPDLPPQTLNAARLWSQLARTEANWIRATIDLAADPHNPLAFAAPTHRS